MFSFSVAEPLTPRLVKVGEVGGSKGVGLLAPLSMINREGLRTGRETGTERNRLSRARSGEGLKVEGASSAADQVTLFREGPWKAALKVGHAQVWFAEAS